MNKLIRIKEKQVSSDGTIKFLSELSDGNLVETVIMEHDYGSSVCISSQAGCSMGCAFCASGLNGKIRDLTADEMLAQTGKAQEILSEENAGRDVTHIVVMGTGEPFDNYEAVIEFCDRASSTASGYAGGNGVAPRHITVSTCGLVPKIYEFAKTPKRYNLAVSLHAPDNKIRNMLMPVNRKYPVEELVHAAADYCLATKHRTAFEYILLDSINDSDECAAKLAALLNESGPGYENFYVNLIPYNNINEYGFKGSGKEKALRFYDILMKNGIKATLRKERGRDISAACGQLRAGSR